MTTAKRIGLILGLIFIGIILSLFSYALIPVKQKSEVVWAVDDKKYDMAYVTLATTDNSVLGVLTLAYTLRETRCKYPLIVLIADQVSESYRTALEHPFLHIRLVRIEKIEPPPTTKIEIGAWREALSKLQAWTLSDYKKLIFLDADQLALQNLDEWFTKPTLTGSVNQDITCIPGPVKTGSQGGLNAGLLIFEPNITAYQNMIELLNNGNSWGDSDQGILSYYYENVEKSVHLIPQQESTFARCCIAPWFDIKQLKLVHFTHFALNYEQLAAENIEAPHHKNWNNIANCDSDLYVMWKRAHHRVLKIVEMDSVFTTTHKDPFWMFVAAITIIGIICYSYVKASQTIQ